MTSSTRNEAHANSSQDRLHRSDDNESTKSLFTTLSPDVDRASKSTNAQSLKGWGYIKQGDQCKDRGELEEAENFYIKQESIVPVKLKTDRKNFLNSAHTQKATSRVALFPQDLKHVSPA
ncbi:hypothetical protein BGX26_006680 [Mortierella sp. AD094]|nr:hypothetical protein BGX26_006680 [Mortierella sp. AD094]